MNSVIPGRMYEHYKGGRYTVLLLVQDSTNARVKDTEKDDMVVYVSLTKGRVWCRELSEFIEPIEWPDGQTRPRFSLLDS
jgi:hypothetical protein